MASVQSMIGNVVRNEAEDPGRASPCVAMGATLEMWFFILRTLHDQQRAHDLTQLCSEKITLPAVKIQGERWRW